MRSVLAVAFVFAVGSTARAHVAGVISVAKFQTPQAPVTTPVDGGVQLEPNFVWQTADASYLVNWMDGDNDPTGVFDFYYLDHQPTFGLTPNDLELLGKPAVATPATTSPVSIYAGCTCDMDAGVV